MDWIRDFFHWTEDNSYSDCLIDVAHMLLLLVWLVVFVFMAVTIFYSSLYGGWACA
jgi:hypothetical protein